MYTAVKRKVFISVCSLLLCFALLVTSSYAWIVLTKAPEIIGIHTQVGANGSLEIALLNDATYSDPASIRSRVGDSMVAANAVESNLSWGNVIDLTDPGYGLDKIVMIPARLNVTENGQGGGLVRNSMLGTLRFGTDGRTERLDMDSVTAGYSEEGFLYDSEKQNYGVRAVGSVPQHSPQQSALTNARSLVKAYTAASAELTKAAWSSGGEKLLGIFQRRYASGSNRFDQQDLSVIRGMAAKLLEAYSYIDGALRQGIIGYGASVLTDPELFRTLRDNAENTAIPLTLLLEAAPTELPSGFAQWVRSSDESRLLLQQAVTACDSLSGGTYIWAQLEPILELLVDGDRAYLGETKLTSPDAYKEIKDGVQLSLAPGSGKFALAADYCGNYSAIFDHSELTAVEVVTTSRLKTPYLTQVSKILEECECPESEQVVTGVALEDIFGFAVDLAFRSNADTQLLLQTDAALRVDDGSELAQMQGEGSNLCMISDQLTVEQSVELMDAMRIAFLDSQNNLLAVAKANTSNYTETEEGVSAPLYLYDYQVGAGGSLIMGERRLEDGCITELTDGVATVITAVVWLDGDHVGNSMVTYREKNVESKLNLQFASSVILKPAHLDVEASE